MVHWSNLGFSVRRNRRRPRQPESRFSDGTQRRASRCARDFQLGAVLDGLVARRSGGLMALTVAALALSGCSIGVLRPQGPVGNADRTILIDSVVIMLAIVVPTILAILGFARRYRASNAKAKYRPDWAYSGRIELVVWGIP